MFRDARGRRALTLGLRVAVVALVATAVLPFASAVSGAQTDGSIDVARLAGPDRYATSLAVAQRFVQESGGSIGAAGAGVRYVVARRRHCSGTGRIA